MRLRVAIHRKMLDFFCALCYRIKVGRGSGVLQKPTLFCKTHFYKFPALP